MQNARLFLVWMLLNWPFVFIGCGGEEQPDAAGNSRGRNKDASLSISGSGQVADNLLDREIQRPVQIAAATGRNITLRLNLQPGQSKQVRATMEMTSLVTGGGQPVDMNVNTRMDAAFTVRQVDAKGNHAAELTFNRMQFAMSGGQSSVHFDTADPNATRHPLGKILTGLIGESLTMNLTPQGEVASMTGLEELADRIGRQDPNLQFQFRQQLDEVKHQFGQLMAVFPPVPIDNGSSWTGTIPVELLGHSPVQIAATYTLVDQKDGVATIHVDGKPAGRFTGGATGTIEVDIASGWTIRTHMKISLVGSTPNGSMTVDSSMNLSSY